MDPAVDDLPLYDLQQLLALGRERGASLLSHEEVEVVERLLALQGPVGRLFARLVSRTPLSFDLAGISYEGVPEPINTGSKLVESDLATDGVGWTNWLDHHARVAQLKDLMRERRLPTTGRRDALVERAKSLAPQQPPGRWITLRHRVVVRRLIRFALLDKRGQASELVIDRLGLRQWPTYDLTPGVLPLHADRDALLRWEALDEESMDGDSCLAALERGDGVALGRLSRVRRLRSRVLDLALNATRAGELLEASRLYDGLVERGGVHPAALAVRRSRTMERRGDLDDALRHLADHRTTSDPAQRLAIHRSGRRLAKAMRRGWAPQRPLTKAPRRRIALPLAGRVKGRPTWTVDGEQHVVEAAVMCWLRGHGRTALWCEGSLIRTLAALLFADTFFLPVPGALPVPRLAGPLDLGSAAFEPSRSDAIADVWRAVDAGQAPDMVRRACDTWHGTMLAWIRQPLDDPERFADACDALGPAGLRCVISPLIDGTGASRGLPDLLVCDGEITRLACHPSRLPAGGRFVEIKGPGDTLSDEQRVWHDRLLRHGVPVEVWHIVPTQ
ncbi:MAG: hypothetical protein ACI9MC_000897 [Kiritimatiellia bacterium]|jgi:hypothetical protein